MSEHLLRLSIICVTCLIAALLMPPWPPIAVATFSVFLVAAGAYLMGFMSGKAAARPVNPPAKPPDATPDSN